MEEKNKNVTEVFRFMDQRGNGKVNRADFVSAIERMRISVSKEDTRKIWNYLDEKKAGFIQLQDLHKAYGCKMSHNLNKMAENTIEQQAAQQY